MTGDGQRRTLGLSQADIREWQGVVVTATTGDIRAVIQTGDSMAVIQTVPDIAVPFSDPVTSDDNLMFY
jgi:hypothetical protein